MYLYPEEAPDDLFGAARTEREPNLTSSFIAALEEQSGLHFLSDGTSDLKDTVGPEDVLAYAYAVFHSPTFCIRYAEFLKIDFPRLPVTSDTDLFRALVRLGHRLIGLHLLRSVPDDDLPAAKTGGKPVIIDSKPRYVAPEASESGRGRVYLNDTQYLDGVPPEAWTFPVGGYQPAEKWLKDRKGRTLSYDDLVHYRKTIAALAVTPRLMAEIDEVIEAHGGFPLT